MPDRRYDQDNGREVKQFLATEGLCHFTHETPVIREKEKGVMGIYEIPIPWGKLKTLLHLGKSGVDKEQLITMCWPSGMVDLTGSSQATDFIERKLNIRDSIKFSSD